MYLVPILASLMTLIICMYAQPLALIFKVMDFPDSNRKQHQFPTPLIGGLAIALPITGTAIFLAITTELQGFYIALSIATLIAFLIGFADDRFDLSPTIRLFLSFILCLGIFSGDLGLIVGVLHTSFESNLISLRSWGGPLTLLAVVGFIYAFNMTDGLDGLAIGQALIWSILLLIIGSHELNWFLITLAAILIITLYFNLTKRLFLGDSGAYAISIIFAIMFIYSYNNVTFVTADMVLLWVLIPVFDCLRLLITRVARGTSPLSPDNNHLHHYLARLLPHSIVVPTILTFIATGGLLTILFSEKAYIWLGVSALLYFTTIVLAEKKR